MSVLADSRGGISNSVGLFGEKGVTLPAQTTETDMKQQVFSMILALGCTWTAMAQPAYDLSRMNREQLNRGVVAVRNGQQVVVSWRTLMTDQVGEAYDVYRNGQKLNHEPLTKGGTFFVDEQPLVGEATYEVRGGQQNGRFVLAADAKDGYLPVKLQKPADGTTPDGQTYRYMANDASVGDVDGDGTYA